MDDQVIVSSSHQNGWRLLFLRWLLGGLLGFGLSALICYGYLSNDATGFLSIVSDCLPLIPFIFGSSLLLFDPSFFGSKELIDSLERLFPTMDRIFIIVLIPSLIWGLVGALLASGRKNQIKVGLLLFLLYAAIGLIASIRVFLAIPT